jgi:hypothetical protein
MPEMKKTFMRIGFLSRAISVYLLNSCPYHLINELSFNEVLVSHTSIVINQHAIFLAKLEKRGRQCLAWNLQASTTDISTLSGQY